MPHCCPQKQQCVFTSRSGSTAALTRCPPGYMRSGPNAVSSSCVSGGSAAIGAPSVVSGRRQGALGQRQHLTPAGGADVLIVPAAHRRQFVAVSHLALHLDEILDVNLRCEPVLAAHAFGLLSFAS